MAFRQQQRGLTLIEAMIALMLVAIISLIALPSYRDFVERSYRADARDALMRIGILQEKYKGSHATYADSIDALGLSATSTAGRYLLSIDQADGSGFTALATPRGDQIDDPCGVFVLNELGPVPSEQGTLGCWSH